MHYMIEKKTIFIIFLKFFIRAVFSNIFIFYVKMNCVRQIHILKSHKIYFQFLLYYHINVYK